MTIVLGSATDPDVEGYDIDAEPIGYIYQPGGAATARSPSSFCRRRSRTICRSPIRSLRWRGMSWIQPVVTEILADKAAQAHKLRFFSPARPRTCLSRSLSRDPPEKFERWRQIFAEQHEGTRNAYKSLFLGAGADAKVVGTDLKQIDFRAVQAYGETRLAAAAGVRPRFSASLSRCPAAGSISRPTSRRSVASVR